VRVWLQLPHDCESQKACKLENAAHL